MTSTIENERVEQGGAPDEAPPPRPAPPQRAPWARRLVPVALVFFFLPAVLSGAGVRAEPFENRELAEFPSLSEGWDFLPGLQEWADDHLPLRREAVRADREVAEKVFGDPPPGGRTPVEVPTGPAVGDPLAPPRDTGSRSPEDRGEVQYPQVVLGRDGYLFYGDEFRLPCEPVRSVEETLQVWNAVVAAIESTGRRVLITVAPDKSSMLPELLPDRYLGEECTTARKQEVRQRLEAGALRRYVDLRGPLLREQESEGEPIYAPTDTHWDDRGAVVLAQTVLDALSPGRFAVEADCRPGERQLSGDLATLAGSPEPRRFVTREVVRPGVSFGGRDLAPSDGTVQRVQSSTVGPPLVPGRVAIVGDSFLYNSRAQVLPYFADVTVAHKTRTGEEDILAAVASADTVVLEVVEREFASGFTGRFSLAMAARLRALPPVKAAPAAPGPPAAPAAPGPPPGPPAAPR